MHDDVSHDQAAVRVREGGGAAASPVLGTAAVSAILAAVYFAAAKVGLSLAFVHPSATAVWPPAGIALAAFLLFGKRVWPGIALGAFLANATTAGSLATSAGIAAGNTLEGLLGAWLVSRFAGGRHALAHPRDVIRFVGLAAGLSTIVSATIGVTTLSVAGYATWSNFGAIWTTWWLGDAVGDLLFAPPILLWSTGWRPGWPRRPLEAVCVGLVLVATAAAFFGGIGQENAPIEWFWIPSVVWVAYRFGQRAVATAVLGLSAVTIWGTELGLGPFVLPSPNTSLLLLQAFLGVVAVLSLTLAAVVAARERVTEDLVRARDELEERVRHRTADLWRANVSLRAEMTERSRLERELLDAGERERLRLGRDLHDDLGQLLIGIAFLSSAMERKLSAHSLPETASVKEIRSLVQEAIAKTHSLSLGLTPVSLGSGGLLAAIQELASMTERVFDVTCVFEYDQVIVMDRPIAATNLYRITQEAISNAIRHGGAHRIDISMALLGEQVTLTIRDDGVGMGREAENQGGLGLGIMKHRAEQLGGTLEVRPGARGTTVVCVVPGIARANPAQDLADL
jgi:two-component system, NarL family, sensor histidine kinase FusK